MLLFGIKENVKYEEIIKSSKFISLIFRVDSQKDVYLYLDNIKKEYPGATHYCYGYVIDNEKKSSDDSEPSKTAGYPIMKQIEGNGLNYVLLVVVRYFGGIKLGIGPLTRTYSKMAGEVIKKACKVSLVKRYNVNVSFSYKEIKKVDFILKDSKVIDKVFDNNVSYNAFVTKETLEKLSKYDISINKEVYIEKE